MSAPLGSLLLPATAWRMDQTKQLLYTPMLNNMVQELSPEITKQIWIMSCSLSLVLQEPQELNLEEEMLRFLGVVQTHRRAERDSALFTGAPVVVQKPSIQAGQGQPTLHPRQSIREGQEYDRICLDLYKQKVLMESIRRTKFIELVTLMLILNFEINIC